MGATNAGFAEAGGIGRSGDISRPAPLERAWALTGGDDVDFIR
jgi:hypothetical protein